MDNAPPEWISVSRETLEKLNHYAAETQRWNGAINLVAKSTLPQLWQRHIWDSAQLLAFGDPSQTWLDIGSGGGFPGLVMAILGAEKVVLVESDQRKATFLREMTRQLNLPVTVFAQRIDDIKPQAAKTITARALAALTELFAHAKPHLSGDGTMIFPKGRGWETELLQAQEKWQFEYEKHPSRTDENAAVLVIRNIQAR